MDLWTIVYDKYQPDHESLREALCTLGNGYFATRGAAEESSDDKIHYPGTYIAGGFNRLKSEVKGKVIENEDFVNWPNWLVLTLQTENGEWLNLDKHEILNFRQELNMKEGKLVRDFTFRESSGRETRIRSTRLVHMKNPHLAALQWEVVPENWSGKLKFKTAIDGSVINNNVKRYSDLKSQHLENLDSGIFQENGMYLEVCTCQSQIRLAEAALTRIYSDDRLVEPERINLIKPEYIGQEFELEAVEGRKIRLEKTVAIFNSRDKASTNSRTEACKWVLRAGNFRQLLHEQAKAWEEYWQMADIAIEDGLEDQQVIRLHLFHLLQTTSKNNIDLDVGVPSRGLHGEAYRGHILWDELFIFPLLNFRIPEITRELILYRYRRLGEAKYLAAENGYRGAMFPWQSGSNGREESQHIHLNPKSGRWVPDETYLQRHVNAAIAYNVWHYFQVSGDLEFMYFYGVEMMLEIALFWESKAEFNQRTERFEIKQVVGPDEYHTRYPEADQPGIDNNAYTNLMAVWVLNHALQSLDLLDKNQKARLLDRLQISEQNLTNWAKISRSMYIPMNEEGLIYQFDGYEKLQELDWNKYHEKYGDILRLDRIMESEEDNVNKYKASKQADVLMLFYLFSTREITQMLKSLGYDFDEKIRLLNIEYYEARTSHGSTLSKLVHSWVLSRSNRLKSWKNFKKALMSDFKDIQGGTTSEGIHLGAMAGTVDLVQRCYTGLEILPEKLRFDPALPPDLKSLKTRIRYRGHWLRLDLNHKRLIIASDGEWGEPVCVLVNGDEYNISQGDQVQWHLD
jgi:trehalose/maltose hydrolase-like predicted phosphorylase